MKKNASGGLPAFPTSLLVRTGFRRLYTRDVDTREEGHSLEACMAGEGKSGRMEGWKNGRMEERKNGRTEERGNGRMEGRAGMIWAMGKNEKRKERALRLRLGPCNEEYGIYFVQLGCLEG